MITDDEVMRLFERADPARLDDDAPVVEAASYLEALRTRSIATATVDAELEPATSRERRPPWRTLLIVGIAAAVVLLVVALVVVVVHDDEAVETAAPTSVAPTPTRQAVEVARAYLDALERYDADGAARDLSAEGLASAGGVDGLRADLRWKEAVSFQRRDVSCDQRDVLPADRTIVRCTYDLDALRSDELGLGPYGDNSYDLTILDGRIVSLEEHLAFDTNGFSEQMWEPFARWIANSSPDDAELMYTDATQSKHQLTDESIHLWEQRTHEYVTLAHRDPVAGVGVHTRTVDDVPFSYTVPAAGWESQRAGAEVGLLIQKSDHGPQDAEALVYWTGYPQSSWADLCNRLSLSPTPSSIEDLAVAVAAAPGVGVVSGPSDAIVGGRAAQHLTLTVRERAGCDPGFFHSWEPSNGGAIWQTSEVGDTIDVWIVDVDRKRLFIVGETSPDAGPEIKHEIELIVESIRFESP